MKDQELKPPEEMKKTQQKKQSKAKGKEAIMKELEAIKRQRIAQKRFMKAEVVSRELLNFAYSLLDYMKKMRECSYISESIRDGKFRTSVVVKYMSTKDGRQIHELEQLDPTILA